MIKGGKHRLPGKPGVKKITLQLAGLFNILDRNQIVLNNVHCLHKGSCLKREDEGKPFPMCIDCQ